ncbi:MAG: thiamine-phosphate kinase [Acidobacteriaceae bacterium]
MTAERELIAGIRARARRFGSGVRLGIGDDCAVLRPRAGHELVVTTDMSLEGKHFRREWHSPESVGHRCLARGLSDIAAMGARPVAAFLSVAVPGELAGDGRRASWVERFLDGLLALAAEHKVTLAGGDTAESPGGVLADIVVLGEAPAGRVLLRSGARAGDGIYVTGALGGAAAELARLKRSARWKSETRKLTRAEGAAHPHFFPQPRIAAGLALQRRGLAAAMIDVSDGISTDLDHLCEESKLRAEVDVAAVPVHALAVEAERRGWTASGLGLALHGGEDYELLFTARAGARVPEMIAGVAVRAIGRMLPANARKPRMMLRHADGRGEPLAARGWEHFGKA